MLEFQGLLIGGGMSAAVEVVGGGVPSDLISLGCGMVGSHWLDLFSSACVKMGKV